MHIATTRPPTRVRARYARRSAAAATLLASLLAVGSVGCSPIAQPGADRIPASAPSGAASAPPTAVEAAQRPPSGFPDLDCEALADPGTIRDLLGMDVEIAADYLANPVILHDNGIDCAWGDPAAVHDGFAAEPVAPVVLIRATPHGAEYWQGYVIGSGHNEWPTGPGDAYGITCSPGDASTCAMAVVAGDVFVEISAAGIAEQDRHAAMRALGARVVPLLVGSVVKVDAVRVESRHPTEECTALLGSMDSADEGLAGARLSAAGSTGRTMNSLAVNASGSTACEVSFGSGPGIDVVRVPGAAWAAAALAEAGRPFASHLDAAATRHAVGQDGDLVSFGSGGDLIQLRSVGTSDERMSALVEHVAARLAGS